MFGFKRKTHEQNYQNYLRTERRAEYQRRQQTSPSVMYGMRFFW